MCFQFPFIRGLCSHLLRAAVNDLLLPHTVSFEGLLIKASPTLNSYGGRAKMLEDEDRV